MKAFIVIATLLVMGLGVASGAPSSMAQDDPDTAPASDQGTAPCPQPADMPPDIMLDGDTPPACQPMDGPDMSKEVNPPAATETPVPTETPRPTDTPQPAAPTETPTPVPTSTSTSTPVPDAPTATPTPTSGSKDVPIGTLSRQLPFANPGENECVFDLASAAKQACDPQTFPAVFTLAFTPFASDAPITLQVDGHNSQTTSKMSWDFLSVPGGVGDGSHTIAASETVFGAALSAKLTVPVQKATSPHFLVYPRVMAPGSSGKIYLAGFPANTVVPLGVYREKPDCNAFGQGNECFELARDLGTIKTNADGTVTRDFSIPANEKQTAYLVATTGLQINAQNAAESLKKFGRPWFVVGQP